MTLLNSMERFPFESNENENEESIEFVLDTKQIVLEDKIIMMIDSNEKMLFDMTPFLTNLINEETRVDEKCFLFFVFSLILLGISC